MYTKPNYKQLNDWVFDNHEARVFIEQVNEDYNHMVPYSLAIELAWLRYQYMHPEYTRDNDSINDLF